jgi:phosphatidate phosphatase
MSDSKNFDSHYDECDHMQHHLSLTNKGLFQIIIDLTVIILVYVSFGQVCLMEPTKAYITCNENLSFPKMKSAVPFHYVLIYGLMIPIVFIFFVELINSFFSSKNFKTKMSETQKYRSFINYVYHTIAFFILGAGITLFVAQFIKQFVGRPRPYFLSACLPNVTLMDCRGFINKPIYTGGDFCTSPDKKSIRTARESFPSLHASFSSYSMLFLIIFLETRLFVVSLRFLKHLIQYSAFVVFSAICVTRIIEHKHRFSDVFAGCVLGISISLLITFRLGTFFFSCNFFLLET